MFLDRNYEALYSAEEMFGKLIGLFTIILIVISSLGIFALSSLVAEQRVKELGIRKALGASVSNLVVLLTREFMILVVFALAISAPFAYHVLSLWLQNFAYRISLGSETFVIAGALTLLITWCAAAYKSLKAALVNPVESLKHE